MPRSCFDAAGGGAPAPSASSSSPAPASVSATGEGVYGEDGGVPPLDTLLSSSSPSSPPSEIPTAALAAAHAAVRLPGSATACVVTLDPETRSLHGVSVGDSGALVVRKNFLLFRSRPSSHSFDCPRQLAAAPEHVEWSDGVEDGEMFEVEGLEEGESEFIFAQCFFLRAFESNEKNLPHFPSLPPSSFSFSLELFSLSPNQHRPTR